MTTDTYILIQVNNRVYVAGQIPLCPASMKIVSGGILHQTALALRHVTRVLKAMGALSGLASTTLAVCYVTQRNHITPALHVWDGTLKKQVRINESRVKYGIF